MNNQLPQPEHAMKSVVPFTYAENRVPYSWSADGVKLRVNGPDLVIETAGGENLVFTMGAELASLHKGIFRITFTDGKSLDAAQILREAQVQEISPERDRAPESIGKETRNEGDVTVKEVVVEDIIVVDSKGGGQTDVEEHSTYAELETPTMTELAQRATIDDSIPLVKKSSGAPSVEHTQASTVPDDATDPSPAPSDSTDPTVTYPKVTLLQVSAWRDAGSHVYQVGSGSNAARTDGNIVLQYGATSADLSAESANWTIDVRNAEYFPENTVARIVRFDEAVSSVSIDGLPASYQAIIGGTPEGNQYGLMPGEILLIYPQSQYDMFTASVSFTDSSGELRQENMTFVVVDNPTSLINGQGQIQLASHANSVSVTGGSGDDVIIAGSGNGAYDGGGGSNTVDFSGMKNALTVDLAGGTASSDGQYALVNVQNVIGTDFDDVLTGDGQDNHLQGGAGNDVLRGGGGNNVLDGGSGINTLNYDTSASGVSVDLSLGVASDNGLGGSDRILNIQNVVGSSHNDLLIGDAADNALYGGGGDDTLMGMGGNNVLNGGAGVNTASYARALVGIDADLTTNRVNNGFGGVDTLINIQNIIGSDFDDRIVSGNGGSSIEAGLGNDTLIIGGDASSRAVLDGGAGDDLFIAGYGYNAFTGGSGFDTLDYSYALESVNISMKDERAYANGFGGIDRFSGIERIIGSKFDDYIELGSSGATIDAGEGNDLIVAGGGSLNHIDGGAGNNTLNYSNAVSGIVVSLKDGEALDNGFGGQDTLANIQNIVGSAWNDVIEGDDSDNVISVGAGDDLIYGSKGNDTLSGGGGSNTLNYSRLAEGINVNMVAGTVLKGADGADAFTQFNRFVGTSQDDTFLVTSGVAAVDGGAGFDVLDFGSLGGSLTINLSSGVVTGRNGTNQALGSLAVSNIEKVIMTSGTGSAFIGSLTEGNEFVGGASNDIFRTNGGNNVVTGGGGSDWVEYVSALHGVTVDLNLYGAGQGFSSDNGFGGQDVLNGISHLRGSNYNDVLTGTGYLEGGAGSDILDGGNSASAYAYYNSANKNKGVTVNLALGVTSEDGYGSQDTLIGIKNVIGSIYADTIYGSDANNIISTREGDDYIYGSRGNDTINGEGGTDTIDYSLMNAAVNVDLSASRANKGVNGTDTLSNIENITGSAYADVLKGSSGSNVIRGGGGDDTLIGLGGNDTLIGGDGFVTADYSVSPKGIVADLTTGKVQDGYGTQDTLISISKITGSAKDDVFEISNNLSLHQYALDGGAGNDVIRKSGSGSLFTLGDAAFNISNIEKLDFSDGQNDTLNVNLSGLFGNYGSNASISLNTDASDVVNITAGGGWSMTSSGVESETWSNGDQTFTWSWA
ncbi:beta strand repeat-containing protein [Leminorella grimontii]|uniref:beta strand repeat-containing protein n=1 Tax=Leminorella grimontii TaxID=82981 RepID=UPI002084F724|nr:hypothetical protein [Leminorella grimontii]GKX61236.1 hypothetical protein SOASR031_35510 [Leminorella grimontii]